ncbi:TetR family transcriptional regulator [Amycolatopsis rhabdoformis]|uniref:TetR family transcriptional regulator n=1 Tax=Amycolatopsis rhabdoformis TaxID=1448059 RepID=A0ABZ1I0Q1_9PSEU|nr:TetR family transcriptional regulator [Amycolatopsis rhabdoformis]WSE27378.1 TetR family transcriptional regulator [Amycolatopsis rhabdoformis]
MPVQNDEAPSFIHAARREQLVRCAIELIAEVGLAQASTVRIAERAGVSRGVLTYHFRDRAELIEQVVRSVYDTGAAFLVPRMRAVTSPRDLLLTFIGGSVELYAAHPTEMAALTAVYAEGVSRAKHRRHTQERSDVEAALREGQERGEFRAFDVGVMYATIRGALDAALVHIAGGGSVEPYASELQTLFDLATTSVRGN